MKMIQFGSENGCTKAGNKIRPYQIKLNDIFFDKDSGLSGFKSLEGMSIVFRVSGKNKHFSGEGPECLQKSRGRNFITIDFVIPQSRWESVSENQFKEYISSGVRSCFELLKEKAIDMNEVGDIERLVADFNKGIELFNAL